MDIETRTQRLNRHILSNVRRMSCVNNNRNKLKISSLSPPLAQSKKRSLQAYMSELIVGFCLVSSGQQCH